MILNILLLIFILGLLIFVHELGHFLVARKSNVHIYEFALGMGPVILSKKGKDGIKYSLRLFPIGGFVQMAGEVDEDDKKIKKERFMCNRPWHQRLLILIAGVTMNFLLAIVLLFVIALFWGASVLKPVVYKATPNQPMAKAGIVAGDEIIAINNKKVNNWDRAQLILAMKSKDNKYLFTIKHQDGKTEKYNITPQEKVDKEGNKSRVFGIEIKAEKTTGFISAIKFAGTKFAFIIESMVIVIGGLFTGKLAMTSLAGPVGMYSIVGETAKMGIDSVLFLVVFLSINLGFINILPFPAFDGGRVVFLLIEKIKGSRVDAKVENVFHTVGFILLMILMLYITFQDVMRLFRA
ncbi:MAG TPA: RIP metalloprotease RseP [Bacilli bacterium]|nr:RIP metalloprotease RseP [Bacilli bacterium]